MSVDEHTAVLASASAFYRRAPDPPDRPVVLHLHGLGMSSDIWDGVLSLTGGVALDLPGFGRSDKGGQLDYTVPGLAASAAQLTSALELDTVDVIGHGWGAVVALQLAAEHPELVRRAVLVEPPGLTDGFSWPRLLRVLRTPLVGEIAIGAITRRMLARALRARSASANAWPDARVAAVWEQLDQGTQRAILLTLRATSADHIGALASRVTAPALILHGRDGGPDARRVAEALPDARLEPVPDAGHWPWLDRPETAQTIATFLAQT